MAAGCVSGYQSSRPCPQGQHFGDIRPCPKQNSPASPRGLAQGSARFRGQRQKVEKNIRDGDQHLKCAGFCLINGCTLKLHSGEVDAGVIHSLESAVIEWSRQVDDVLKKSSSEPLLATSRPAPDTKLLFWKNRWAPYIHGRLFTIHFFIQAAANYYFF